MQEIQAIVLAAGKASRFKTGTSKLLEPICGQAMIVHVTQLLQQLQIPTIVIVGYQKEQLIQTIMDSNPAHIAFVEQREQKGTGHAVLCSQPTWTAENLLIINGDMPLISSALIAQLFERHQTTNATISFVVAHLQDPTGTAYGRVIQGKQVEIVEDRDFSGDKSAPCFINAGIYLVKRSFLEHAITTLHASSVTAELYVTDLVKKASHQGLHVELVATPFDTIRGVNTLEELWTAQQIIQQQIIYHWMSNGVRFDNPAITSIDAQVTIGAGTHLGAGVHISGNSSIGKQCVIAPYSIINNSILDDQSVVLSHCVLDKAHLKSHANVGPFAHIQNSTIDDKTVIGNFVEIKRSHIGSDARIKHLSYLGDAQIAEEVNIGAGTITCNYDGYQKHKTIIERGAHIGSLNALIAPLTIGEHSITAAGSAITDDVPADSLAIARTRQTIKDGYALKYRSRKSNQSSTTESV